MREPQQERSRTTRRRLVDAAIAALADHGWNGVTVGLIAQRAGVSRGAAQHYFPTREDLVMAALAQVDEVLLDELREQAASLPNGAARAEPVAELLLNLYTGPMFRAALQLWVAASTDQQLRATLIPLEAKVGREVHRVAVELLGVDESRPGVRATVQATLDLARGLGLANLLTDDRGRRKQIIQQWARMLKWSLTEQDGAPAGEPS